jgi:hypothetical protein
MQLPLSQQGQQSASNATGATSGGFIETVEYDRFIEFCDACRRFRYIGLCYGPPGVGKTLSAFHYSRSEMIVSFDRWTSQSRDQLPINTILYTTAVINTPSRIESDIGMARERLMGIAMNPIRLEAKEVLDAIRLRDEASRREILTDLDALHVIGHRSTRPTSRRLNSMKPVRKQFRTRRHSSSSTRPTGCR